MHPLLLQGVTWVTNSNESGCKPALCTQGVASLQLWAHYTLLVSAIITIKTSFSQLQCQIHRKPFQKELFFRNHSFIYIFFKTSTIQGLRCKRSFVWIKSSFQFTLINLNPGSLAVKHNVTRTRETTL